VQVDPIKPTLEELRTERLKLECGELLSSFAFKLNLRRYTEELSPPPAEEPRALLPEDAARIVAGVGPGRYRPPRHRPPTPDTHFEPSFVSDIL
jgi:hypothetical protein